MNTEDVTHKDGGSRNGKATFFLLPNIINFFRNHYWALIRLVQAIVFYLLLIQGLAALFSPLSAFPNPIFTAYSSSPLPQPVSGIWILVDVSLTTIALKTFQQTWQKNSLLFWLRLQTFMLSAAVILRLFHLGGTAYGQVSMVIFLTFLSSMLLWLQGKRVPSKKILST